MFQRFFFEKGLFICTPKKAESVTENVLLPVETWSGMRKESYVIVKTAAQIHIEQYFIAKFIFFF